MVCILQRYEGDVLDLDASQEERERRKKLLKDLHITTHIKMGQCSQKPQLLTIRRGCPG
jgi:hypothetical protein